MMGVMTRMRRILRANLHAMLDQAENPVKMLTYLVLEIEENLEQARQEVAVSMAGERRLAQQAREAEESVGQWEQRARIAIAHQQDELAREALRRKAAATEIAVYYRHATTQQTRAVQQLRNALQRLEMRLREAKSTRDMLLAQMQTTRARQVVVRASGHDLGESALEAFDRASQQILLDQHRAEALLDLKQDHLEETFLAAEEAAAIEHELMALKHETEALPDGEEHDMLAIEETEDET